VAKTDEKVMRMVEQELGKNPEVSVDELFDKAKKLNSGVSRMTRRQFHARYPLQVKRRSGAGRRARKAAKAAKAATAAAPAAGGARRGRPPKVRAGVTGDAGREAMRGVFLRFAQDVASATSQPGALVKVILGVDRYVDEALKTR
jgi:hypothetical protein